jgi:SAM-dependent methyltransferase
VTPESERPRVDYDTLAATFDRRYAHNDYSGTAAAIARFVEKPNEAILEVGCGTGHWLAAATDATTVSGIDRSWEMLLRARATAPSAMLAHAAAEHLPFASGTFDRIFCVNALHHFGDHMAFLREAHRVLRRNGALLTIGLDPHTAIDQWWVYDYFPAAREADLRRYPSTDRLRSALLDAGFARASTSVVHHKPVERAFDVAVEQGLLDRHWTSQLLVISDEAYEAGLYRLHAERPMLRADIRLYGTIAEKRPAIER